MYDTVFENHRIGDRSFQIRLRDKIVSGEIKDLESGQPLPLESPNKRIAVMRPVSVTVVTK